MEDYPTLEAREGRRQILDEVRDALVAVAIDFVRISFWWREIKSETNCLRDLRC